MQSSDTRAQAAPLPLKGTVPLVLHRVVQDTPEEWEDVRVEQFRQIVDKIGSRWAVFREDNVMDQARWMLTFDDGNASDYEIVFPLLQEARASATFFLITDQIGQKGFLNWSQIEEMHRQGMCIGSHSQSHQRMSSLSSRQAEDEFCISKDIIEQRLGTPVEAFSYPFGDCTKGLHKLGLAAGYRQLCSSVHGVTGSSARVLPRNSIHSGMDWSTIDSVMEPTIAKRMTWYAEDLVKGLIKGVLGQQRYTRWRDGALR